MNRIAGGLLGASHERRTDQRRAARPMVERVHRLSSGFRTAALTTLMGWPCAYART
jgi:hypothetical protein